MAPATTETYTLSLHDALPISFHASGDGERLAADVPRQDRRREEEHRRGDVGGRGHAAERHGAGHHVELARDRKSTRLNSSHANISYAVFCLKKKNKNKRVHTE